MQDVHFRTLKGWTLRICRVVPEAADDVLSEQIDAPELNKHFRQREDVLFVPGRMQKMLVLSHLEIVKTGLWYGYWALCEGSAPVHILVQPTAVFPIFDVRYRRLIPKTLAIR